MRDREVPAHDTHDDKHGEHRDGERQQQNSRDAEYQAHDQHAEGGQQQDLAQQSGDERPAERVGDGIGYHFQVLPAEHHQTEAEHGEREEDAETRRRAAAEVRSECAGELLRLPLRGRREDGGRPRVRDLAADLTAPVPHVTPEREDVARHHSTGVDHHIALHRHQITAQGAVDVGVPLHHEQMPGEAFGRADAVVAPARGAAGDSDPEIGAGLERGAEPVFDDRGLGEIAEVDGAATLRNGLRAGVSCGRRSCSPTRLRRRRRDSRNPSPTLPAPARESGDSAWTDPAATSRRRATRPWCPA